MSTTNINSTRPETLKYAIIGAAAMGAAIYILLFVGMYAIHGRIFTGLDEPSYFYPLYFFWVCMGGYAGVSFRKQYLAHTAAFMEEHKDLPSATAQQFAVESFRILYAKQLFPVVASFPLAYYLYEWARPDSIGDIAFIAAIELVALWLYRITKRYREGAVHNGPF